MSPLLATRLVTWWGVGTLSKAPGTLGSLAALPLAYAIHTLAGSLALAMASGLIFALGIVACHHYLRTHPEKDDPQEIVIDEVAGQCLLLSVCAPTLTGYLLGFVLFRLCDICKPWPISFADRTIGGGLGVMLDDMLAALYPIALTALYIGVLYGLGVSTLLADLLWQIYPR